MTACVRARRDDGPNTARLSPSLPDAAGLSKELSRKLSNRRPCESTPELPTDPLPFSFLLPKNPGARPGGRYTGVGAVMLLPLGETMLSLLDELDSERSSVCVLVPWLLEELMMTGLFELPRWRE